MSAACAPCVIVSTERSACHVVILLPQVQHPRVTRPESCPRIWGVCLDPQMGFEASPYLTTSEQIVSTFLRLAGQEAKRFQDPVSMSL